MVSEGELCDNTTGGALVTYRDLDTAIGDVRSYRVYQYDEASNDSVWFVLMGPRVSLPELERKRRPFYYNRYSTVKLRQMGKY